MELRIEAAGIEELEKLMEWRMRVLREVFSVPPGDTMEALAAENREYYLATLPAGGHIACFARDGAAVVGCGGVCLYKEMPSPDNANGSCAYLMNIYTLPEYRRRGVGGEIVRWLVARAKEKGASKIFLETSDSGRALYKELGFEDMKDYMKLER